MRTSSDSGVPLRDLCRVFGRIGVLSFGGPAAQIALMQKELVEERPWLTQPQFLRALSFCMLLPGPEAMQLATYAGWRLYGTMGGVIAGLLFVLPGALVITALALTYAFVGQLPVVQALFLGVKAAVVAVLLQALIRLTRKALGGFIHWAIAAASFLAIYMAQLPFPVVIFVAAIIGALSLQHHEPTTPAPAPQRSQLFRTVLLWATIWLTPLVIAGVLAPAIIAEIARFFSVLAVVTFGGAYAVLAYMTQAVVGEFQWLHTSEMIDALGLAETTPGPLILVTQFVGMLAGFKAGGVGLALLAGVMTLWATFTPCFLWIFAGAPYIDRLAHMPRLSGALSAITAAVVGVIANLGVWFTSELFFISAPASEASVFAILNVPAVLIALLAGGLLWRRIDLLIILPICAFCGWLFTALT